VVSATARNLVIITLDSVRADYFQGIVLDRLKAEGTWFRQAITCAPSTPESHAALFSGCYPPIHGLRNHQARSNDRTPHLLEVLEGAGFDVAACTRLASMPARVIGSSDDIVAATHELRGWRGPRRHALFFHVWRTHFPYLIASPMLRSQPPTAVMQGLLDPAVRSTILSGYEQALRCAEHELISPLEDTLRRVDAWDDTLVVIWSDHGEAFGAGGEPFHGFSLVDETLRVPVLFRGPGVPAGLVVDSQLRTIDIAPTVLELLGVTFDNRFFWRPEGESVVPWFADPGARTDRLAYAECCAGGKTIGLGRPFDSSPDPAALRRDHGFRYAVRMPPWKLVAGAAGAQLFDLRRASAESEPVDDVAGMTAAAARAMLEHTLLGVDGPSASPTSGGRALLESLGYIDDAPAPPDPASSGESLGDGDGIYPSYDLLWSTDSGHLASPRLLHYHDKNSHCELTAQHLYILGLIGDGRTVRSVLGDLAARLARSDAELLGVFPQFALDAEQLATTIERLGRQGFVVDGEPGLALAAGVTLDVVEAVLQRADDRLIADLDGLEAIAIEHMLAGTPRDQALAHARDHARDRLRDEAREVLELAAKRHLLRVRKAEQMTRVDR
jgi:arylsulfatase